MKIKKLLIANRGEIAIRIARTCRRLGIHTIGVCSELDRKSLHVDFCDEIHTLGEGSVAETYLNIPKLIEIIRRSGAQAVHPGYGFLSERAPFAQAVLDTGAAFVGPRPETIEAMGDKLRAKEVMRAMGVPLIPGSDGPVRELSEARKVADAIGYPVLLKAAAGGGGKGIRIVRKAAELKAALESATHEAEAYFGDGTVYIEKYLENPHHIEVQVLGDGYGGGGHVFDRECSIQRRHQKLLEESPAPLLMRHPKSRAAILELANRVVEQMKYANAGTLEFLGDDDGNFYFLEMNTRLQVEHPVTEWTAGIELVEQQLRVADGARLPKGPLAESQRGHSIEVRIYAETPFEHLPTGGRVLALQNPAGPFIRVDSAIYLNYQVPTEYDPTLMKLSVWGADRTRAVARLREALDELRIGGVQNNQGLFWAIVREKDFIEGNYGTPYLEKHKTELRAMYDAGLRALAPVLSLGAIHGLQRPDLVMGQVAASDESSRNQPGAWELSARRGSIREAGV